MMRRLPLTLAVLVLLAAPTVAQAHTRKVVNPMAAALEAAVHYWGTYPCEGHITLTTSAEPPADESLQSGDMTKALASEEATLLAWATFVETKPHPSECVVTFYEGYFGNWAQDDEKYQELCDVMTHELGHFLGHSDNGQTDRRSIEYPLLGEEAPNFNSVPECKGRIANQLEHAQHVTESSYKRQRPLRPCGPPVSTPPPGLSPPSEV